MSAHIRLLAEGIELLVRELDEKSYNYWKLRKNNQLVDYALCLKNRKNIPSNVNFLKTQKYDGDDCDIYSAFEQGYLVNVVGVFWQDSSTIEIASEDGKINLKLEITPPGENGASPFTQSLKIMDTTSWDCFAVFVYIHFEVGEFFCNDVALKTTKDLKKLNLEWKAINDLILLTDITYDGCSFSMDGDRRSRATKVFLAKTEQWPIDEIMRTTESVTCARLKSRISV